MAQWPRINHKIGTDVGTGEMISFGKGINTFLSPYVGQQGAIDKETSPFIDNAIVNQYPILEPRRGLVKSFDETPTSPLDGAIWGFGKFEDDPLVQIDKDLFRFYISSWQEVTNIYGDLPEYYCNIITYNYSGDEYAIISSSQGAYSYEGTTFADIADMPHTRFTCVDDKRVWALVDGILHFSAAGDFSDWTTADDAGSIELTGFDGIAAGVYAYQNVVIAWSTRTMHLLYGDETDDYYLSDPIRLGLLSQRSIIEHRGILYFMGYDRKVYMYTGGGIPTSISEPIKTWLDDMDTSNGIHVVAATSYDKFILFSIPIGGSDNSLTFIYDTDFKIWQKWNFGMFDFVKIAELCYGLRDFADDKNYIFKLFGDDWTDNLGYEVDDQDVQWNYYTGYWTEGTIIGNKVLTAIHVHYYKPSGSQMAIGYETNASGSFTTLETLAANTIPTVYRVEIDPSILYNAKFFRLKFTCQGEGKIFGIEPEYRIKRR